MLLTEAMEQSTREADTDSMRLLRGHTAGRQRSLLVVSGLLNVALTVSLASAVGSAGAASHATSHRPNACTVAVDATPRFTGPRVDQMTPPQRAIYDEIATSRPTGVKGPFGPWLASPGIAQPAQTLGRVCRLETSLARQESELAILLTAARHNASTEWAIHSSEARKAGEQRLFLRRVEGSLFFCSSLAV